MSSDLIGAGPKFRLNRVSLALEGIDRTSHSRCQPRRQQRFVAINYTAIPANAPSLESRSQAGAAGIAV